MKFTKQNYVLSRARALVTLGILGPLLSFLNVNGFGSKVIEIGKN